jgi:AraC family transcriptional regulator
MPQHEPGPGDRIEPSYWRKIIPFDPFAASDRLGWVGLEAARFRTAAVAELEHPALTHHTLVLFAQPPRELLLRYTGVDRHTPPPAGSVSLMPAGCPCEVRTGPFDDQLFVFLAPGLVEQVAAEAFGVDPARLTLPPLDGLDLPQLRAAMVAVAEELATGGAGGRLAAESLANVLAVHLIRQVLTPRPGPARRRDSALSPSRLRAVVEYVEGHLYDGPTLGELASAARLSPYHFARQFKLATGLPPHQYVIARRVERAKQILRSRTGLSLADVATHVGFSDQSQFCRHFKRVVGLTPREFRMSARFA